MRYSIPLNWRRIPQRYRLIGCECKTCGNMYFPKRPVCPNCRRKGEIVEKQFSGKGKIISFTKVHVPPEGFEEQAPYILAIIALEEGARVMAQIVDTDLEKVTVGAPVEMAFRVIQKDDPEGPIHYGFKFRLSE